MKYHKLEILEETIPLRAPLLIMIEPTNRCNFKCVYCPTGDQGLLKNASGRQLGDMDFKLFKKIIDGMNDFLPLKIKRVQLFKDGESLLHPDIIGMIKYAKMSAAINEVDITTNGSLLNSGMAEGIVLSGLDTIRVSFEGSILNEEYKRMTRTGYTYDNIKNNLYLLAEAKKRHGCGTPYIEAKLVNTGIDQVLKDKFMRDFMGMAQEATFDPLVDRKGGTGRIVRGEKELLAAEVCPVPFYGLAINFNGTVSVCCADWNHTTVVGDIKRESLYEIWHGDRLHAFRKMQVEFRKSEHALCGKCEYMKRLPRQSNIDKLAKNNPAKILARDGRAK